MNGSWREIAMSDSVDLLLQRLRANDPSVAELVFQRFSDQLIRLAQERMNLRLRRKFDPEDVVQSAFQSFFRMQAQDELTFENVNALWGLLSLLTIRKLGHRIEHYQAACRDIGREFNPVQATDDSESSRSDWEAISQAPSPSHAAMMAETVNELMEPLDDRDRQIVQLALQGATVYEISQDIKRSERTVERVLSRLKSELIKRLRPPN